MRRTDTSTVPERRTPTTIAPARFRSAASTSEIFSQTVKRARGRRQSMVPRLCRRLRGGLTAVNFWLREGRPSSDSVFWLREGAPLLRSTGCDSARGPSGKLPRGNFWFREGVAPPPSHWLWSREGSQRKVATWQLLAPRGVASSPSIQWKVDSCQLWGPDCSATMKLREARQSG